MNEENLSLSSDTESSDQNPSSPEPSAPQSFQADEQSISSGDFFTVSGNIPWFPETGTLVLQNEIPDLENLETAVSSLDLKLTIIIFLMLFYWCERKVKYGVRGLMGRNIDV